ncbi:hypothetical protein [Streptomyces sp. NPDC005181]|uniref:hypothetical protein n=1 Tax=Streptomyces sp. NPDC005181 TaxID=3156869 RepID=UPI0033B42800
MRTNKAFATLCSALFAGSLTFVPAVISQASAAPKPAQATAEHDAVARPYKDGYRQDFRNGYSDAKDDCDRSSRYRNQGYGYSARDAKWARGFPDGYDEGYSRAFDRFY